MEDLYERQNQTQSQPHARAHKCILIEREKPGCVHSAERRGGRAARPAGGPPWSRDHFVLTRAHDFKRRLSADAPGVSDVEIIGPALRCFHIAQAGS